MLISAAHHILDDCPIACRLRMTHVSLTYPLHPVSSSQGPSAATFAATLAWRGIPWLSRSRLPRRAGTAGLGASSKGRINSTYYDATLSSFSLNWPLPARYMLRTRRVIYSRDGRGIYGHRDFQVAAAAVAALAQRPSRGPRRRVRPHRLRKRMKICRAGDATHTDAWARRSLPWVYMSDCSLPCLCAWFTQPREARCTVRRARVYSTRDEVLKR